LGRRKKEEGRRKKEEGIRRKKEEGRMEIFMMSLRGTKQSHSLEIASFLAMTHCRVASTIENNC
jgi:hypothetical protein